MEWLVIAAVTFILGTFAVDEVRAHFAKHQGTADAQRNIAADEFNFRIGGKPRAWFDQTATAFRDRYGANLVLSYGCCPTCADWSYDSTYNDAMATALAQRPLCQHRRDNCLPFYYCRGHGGKQGWTIMEGHRNRRRLLAAWSVAESRQEAANARRGGEGQQVDRPDPEVPEKATRRRYSAPYKLKILREADKCSRPGELGELLRREGLYSSHLKTWKKQREEGTLQGLAPKKRGRKAKRKDALADEVDRLRRKNEQLEQRLQQAETIIDVQKKLCTMLGLPHAADDRNENEE